MKPRRESIEASAVVSRAACFMTDKTLKDHIKNDKLLLMAGIHRIVFRMNCTDSGLEMHVTLPSITDRTVQVCFTTGP